MRVKTDFNQLNMNVLSENERILTCELMYQNYRISDILLAAPDTKYFTNQYMLVFVTTYHFIKAFSNGMKLYMSLS